MNMNGQAREKSEMVSEQIEELIPLENDNQITATRKISFSRASIFCLAEKCWPKFIRHKIEKSTQFNQNLEKFFFCIFVNSVEIKVFDVADSEFCGVRLFRFIDFRITAKMPNLPGYSGRNFLFLHFCKFGWKKGFDFAVSACYGL